MANYRSGFERTLATQLRDAKVQFKYESVQLPYVTEHVYTPDFVLPNGVIVEAKGVLDQQTRSKMLAVKRAHPKLDIRFCFMAASNKLSRRSNTTYGDWCDKHGFPWADKRIPEEWFK